MLTYKQIGKNKKFPKQIEIWKLGEDAPDWLTDVCKVTMNRDGILSLITQETNTGGYKLLVSGNDGKVFLSVRKKEDIVCKNLDYPYNIFSISEKALNLMYVMK